jgi:hypothetical protein
MCELDMNIMFSKNRFQGGLRMWAGGVEAGTYRTGLGERREHIIGM